MLHALQTFSPNEQCDAPIALYDSDALGSAGRPRPAVPRCCRRAITLQWFDERRLRQVYRARHQDGEVEHKLITRSPTSRSGCTGVWSVGIIRDPSEIRRRFVW